MFWGEQPGLHFGVILNPFKQIWAPEEQCKCWVKHMNVIPLPFHVIRRQHKTGCQLSQQDDVQAELKQKHVKLDGQKVGE